MHISAADPTALADPSHAGAPDASAAGAPRVLIATTTWWAFPARIAMAFQEAGFDVEAVCPKDHPLLCTGAVHRVYRYRALQPLRALRAAIEACRPTLIVPCDDRAVAHLHRLHAAAPDGAVAAIIAASLGDPASFPIVQARARFIEIARQAGVRAPDMAPVPLASDIGAAVARVGLPAVMKTDGTWGGLGTQIVTNAADALSAWQQATRKLSAARAFKRLLVNRDPYHVLAWLRGKRAGCGLQAMAPGLPANCIAACWQGEVLSLICVEVVTSSGTLGAATVVRVIEHAEIAEATRRVVRRLGLSGFCGLDFLLDPATGAANLLEINPRSTPLCHLALGPGRAPVAALAARASRTQPREPEAITDRDVIAYFPQAWHLNPAEPALRLAYHDVPWREPNLVRELIRMPRPDRGPLAALARGLQRAWRRDRKRAKGQILTAADFPLAECGLP